MAEEYFPKQTKVSADVIKKLKIYSLTNNFDNLQELFFVAINDFLKYRLEVQKNDGQVAYLASPRTGKELNIKLTQSMIARITKISEFDDTSVRRFLYTAIMHFFEKNIEKKRGE